MWAYCLTYVTKHPQKQVLFIRNQVIGHRVALISKDTLQDKLTITQAFCEDLQQALDAMSAFSWNLFIYDGVKLDQSEKYMDIASVRFCSSVIKFSEESPQKKFILASSAAISPYLPSVQTLLAQFYEAEGWTWEDYLGFLRKTNDAKVKAKFPNADALDAVFYYAGASARWLFHNSVDEIIGEIGLHARTVFDVSRAQQDRPGSKHHLFFKGKAVSSYAFRYVCQQNLDAVFGLIGKTLETDKNPAVEGWVLESFYLRALFLSGLQTHTYVLILLGRNMKAAVDGPENLQKMTLQAGKYSVYETAPLFTSDEWLVPLSWNQGGFDFFLSAEGKGNTLQVTFFQVTRAQSHTFKMKYFVEAANMLLGYGKTEGLTQHAVLRKGDSAKRQKMTDDDNDVAPTPDVDGSAFRLTDRIAFDASAAVHRQFLFLKMVVIVLGKVSEELGDFEFSTNDAGSDDMFDFYFMQYARV